MLSALTGEERRLFDALLAKLARQARLLGVQTASRSAAGKMLADGRPASHPASFRSAGRGQEHGGARVELVRSAAAACIVIEGDAFWPFLVKGGPKPTKAQARRQSLTMMQAMVVRRRGLRAGSL